MGQRERLEAFRIRRAAVLVLVCGGAAAMLRARRAGPGEVANPGPATQPIPIV